MKDMTYEPGSLEAVAYENGSTLGRMSLVTACDAERALQLTPEYIGELIFIPFQVTWVCEAEVPLKETVERDPLPYCFTKIELLYVSTSAIDCETVSLRAEESSSLRC